MTPNDALLILEHTWGEAFLPSPLSLQYRIQLLNKSSKLQKQTPLTEVGDAQKICPFFKNVKKLTEDSCK